MVVVNRGKPAVPPENAVLIENRDVSYCSHWCRALLIEEGLIRMRANCLISGNSRILGRRIIIRAIQPQSLKNYQSAFL